MFPDSPTSFFSLPERFKKSVLASVLALLICLAGQNAFAFDSGTIKGIVRAVAAGGATTQSTVIANAKLTLTSHATPNQPLRTVSNASGEFIFENLPSGDYTLTVEANGLTKSTKEIKLEAGALLVLDIQLTATVNESVTIRDEEGLVSTSDTTTSNIVRIDTLKNQPLRNDNFQNAIQLTPGAVRDGFGNDYLKGTRTGQSGYTVNGADVTDPVSGNLAFNIPLEAVSSVQIEENPYSASLGRFTGAVTNVQTKGGGDKFKVSAARWFPTFHNIFTTRIDTFRPRLTLSGPIIRKKLYFLQSFEYRFTRIYAPSQPAPNNSTVYEGYNSFTQIDWNINKGNMLRFNAALFPNKIRNLGLDTFNPVAATPNYTQRGMLFSLTEQSVFKRGSFLISEVSYKTFDTSVFAKTSLPFNLAPATNSGGYFGDTRRQSSRIQWQETFYSRPLEFHGEHSIKAGFEFYNTLIGGQLRYSSIFIRRIDNTLAQRIDFTTPSRLNYRYDDAAGFVQDRWVASKTLTLDYGVRIDRDGVTRRTNFAPRFSILARPGKDAKTVVRAGAGIFYDRSLSFVGYIDGGRPGDPGSQPAALEQFPERIVTNYAADGTTVIDGPRAFDFQIRGPFRTPRSIRWSTQVDRQVTSAMTLRFGFLQRFTTHDLIVNPVVVNAATGTQILSSTGRSRYSEFQAVMVYNSEKYGRWTGFYVYSRARGDLNSADRFFSDTPEFVLRPNEYGRLPFDAPHRIMFYGQFEVSKKYKVRLSPLIEVRSGFPFSSVNERHDYVGGRNAAGRFPAFVSFDMQVTKGFKLPVVHKVARVGVAVFNITNHFNPRDVQTNLTSLDYGKFYNSLRTTFKAKFDIDF